MMSRYSIRQCSHRGTHSTSCSIQPQPIRIEQRIAPLVSSSSSRLRYSIRRSLVTSSSSSTTTASAPVVGNIVPRRTHRPRPPGTTTTTTSSGHNTTTTTHSILNPANTRSSSPGSSSNHRYPSCYFRYSRRGSQVTPTGAS